MKLAQQIGSLLRKEILVEWRQRYAINGLVLYGMCMVFMVAMQVQDSIQPATWNLITWLVIVFMSINANAKSFLAEPAEQQLYWYNLVSPMAVIIAKMIYNAILLGFLSLVTTFLFWVLSGPDIEQPLWFWLAIVAGSWCVAISSTLLSAIAAKATRQGTLLAVLSFPILLPVLANNVSLTRKSIEGIAHWQASEIQILIGITGVFASLSVLLFPLLWVD
ncbi:MAG: heme exporter protein CcmB [Bacteroidia bacterium]|nr:heme exporter protein CcmB [Bacteroidia bacterium]